ncbi:MAG TPA: hypothetical protein VHC69_01360 [Polyangiaceae bacterium]|nr:hypothetical protein [Polyangiaceae bacterium]
MAFSAGVRLTWIAPALDQINAGQSSIDIIFVEWDVKPPFRLALATFLEQRRRPTLVLVGAPTRTDLFELARAGVEHYAEFFTADTFRNAKARARASAEWQLRHAARANLGRLGVKTAQRLVRTEMFREALLAENGNRHAVARVLQVDRRYVLKMAKETAAKPALGVAFAMPARSTPCHYEQAHGSTSASNGTTHIESSRSRATDLSSGEVASVDPFETAQGYPDRVDSDE